VGITIRDTDGDNAAEVTIGAANAYILKEQTLTLETGVQLVIDSANSLWLAGDAGTEGGAQLKGPGKVVVAGTTITGGSRGWRVFGADSIGIAYVGATEASIANVGAATFRAQGAGATITQADTTKLSIGAGTAIELGGTPTTAGGVIVLEANAAELAFTATSKLLLGAGTGGTAAAGVATITIGGKSITNTSLTITDYQQVGGVLVQIGGTNAGSITATSAGDVTLASNSAFTGI
jgi:hypothetical protein